MMELEKNKQSEMKNCNAKCLDKNDSNAYGHNATFECDNYHPFGTLRSCAAASFFA